MIGRLRKDSGNAAGVNVHIPTSPVQRRSANNSRDDDLTDNMILKNLEDATSDIEDPYQNEDQIEEDDDPEMLQELERRKEEILEEFLEIAYQKKHESIEEAKAECKKTKMAREQEKKKI